MLRNVPKVQECDARMLNSYSVARLIIAVAFQAAIFLETH